MTSEGLENENVKRVCYEERENVGKFNGWGPIDLWYDGQPCVQGNEKPQ